MRPSKISASLLNSDLLRMMEDLELFQMVKFLLQRYSSGSNDGHGPYIVGVVQDTLTVASMGLAVLYILQ